MHMLIRAKAAEVGATRLHGGDRDKRLGTDRTRRAGVHGNRRQRFAAGHSVATEFKSVQTLFNTALPEKGANLTSPVDGAIVRWRMQDAEGGPFRLRILRPNGSGAVHRREHQQPGYAIGGPECRSSPRTCRSRRVT